MVNLNKGSESMAIEFNNLKLYRKQSGMTQEQVAEKLGVSRQAVAKWESGESLPDIENIIALSDLYGTSVDFLVRNMTQPVSDPEGRRHMFGMTMVNDKGQITLPKKSRELFGLGAGTALLVLADEDKGIALVKMSECLFDK